MEKKKTKNKAKMMMRVHYQEGKLASMVLEIPKSLLQGARGDTGGEHIRKEKMDPHYQRNLLLTRFADHHIAEPCDARIHGIKLLPHSLELLSKIALKILGTNCFLHHLCNQPTYLRKGAT